MLPPPAIEALFSIAAPAPAGDVCDVSAAVAGLLPARPGVLHLVAASGETVLLLATADLRAAALKRLVPDADEPANGTPGGVASRIRAAPLGDLFEAERVWLELARTLAPADHAAAVERRRTWWAAVDPGAHAPHWARRSLGDLAPEASGDGRGGRTMGDLAWLGPMPTKSAADRVCRALDELFSLCREPATLAARPTVACVYKEMGSCPAPCDGSEPMDAFRERVRASTRFTPGQARAVIEDLEREMKAAASALDFERAQSLQARCEQLGALTARATMQAARLSELVLVACAPAWRSGWVGLSAASVWRTGRLPDVRGSDPPVAELARRIAGLRTSEAVFEREALERFELCCQALTRGRAGARARVIALRVRDGVPPDLSELLSAIRAAGRPPRRSPRVASEAPDPKTDSTPAEANP